MSDESTEPHITALVRADGTGTVTVDGETSDVHADDIEGVRGAIIARVAEIAVAHDRPVRVATTDLDGIYPLIVHPGGAVDSDGPMIPADTLAEVVADSDDDATGGDNDDDADGGAESGGTQVATDSPETEATSRAQDESPLEGDQPASDHGDDRSVTAVEPEPEPDPGPEPEPDFDPLHDTVVRAYAPPASVEPGSGSSFGATVIPPPPFGVDSFASDDSYTPSGAVAPSLLGDGEAKGFVPAPSRRSTFQTFDETIGRAEATQSGDDATGAEHDEQRHLDDNQHASPTGSGSFDSSVGADVDPPALSETSVSNPPADPAPDQPAPGLDALFAMAGSASMGSALVPAPAADAADEAAPTLDDFLQSRPSAPDGPAKMGWQRVVRRMTGGLISPKPGKAERAHRHAISRVQRSMRGPRTIVVLNPKGGAHKTTATLLLAATFGIHRGGSTLAWDNNETRGTLGWRAQPSRHSNTAVDLLRDLDKFADVKSARVGYLDSYVRAQGDAQFDVLASDEDAAASSTIDAAAFKSLHHTLSRFYRVLVIDTGNNMRASNWEAAVDAADQLVVVTTVNEETAASAAWLLDGLRQKGHQDKVSKAVTILSSPGDTVQPELTQRLHAHFAALTRVVLEVPYDPGFQSGGPLNVDVLMPQTREAWLQVTAAVADGL
ncbi:MinD-like ATPase involved in chromosome partitioning or flagellar assembly [Mycetocola sp. CAN_C7]|uniref:MinD/ParA family ATP-binding protein n=1 Tax=Mycetocola sp. CAN_C7 TaxID=2787724 RepID=UPI0018CA99C2